jgi:hypothetical protein
MVIDLVPQATLTGVGSGRVQPTPSDAAPGASPRHDGRHTFSEKSGCASDGASEIVPNEYDIHLQSAGILDTAMHYAGLIYMSSSSLE